MSEVVITTMRPRTKTTAPTVLSNAVKELRELMEMTQAQFAQLLGVTITTVARWETFRNPNGEILLKLRALSSKMADAAKSSGHTDLEEKLLDIDDLFYAALIQESPAHRTGNASAVCFHIATVQMGSDDGTPGLYEVLQWSQSDQPIDKERLRQFAKSAIRELKQAKRLVDFFDGWRLKVPREFDAADIARVMVPDVLSGHVQYSQMPDKQKAAEAEKIAGRLAKKKSARKKAS